jgi:hypothetical protein
VRSAASDLLVFHALLPPSSLPALVLHVLTSDSGVGASPVAPVDSDTAGAERADEGRAIGASRRRPIPGMDGPAGIEQGAQPSLRLHRQLHPSPRARLHCSGEPIYTGLCHHYGVELHNFAPNAISQAASFVAVCEGFLGNPANWDLWVHLFCGELHTLTTGERGCAGRFALVALRSCCETRARSCTRYSP